MIKVPPPRSGCVTLKSVRFNSFTTGTPSGVIGVFSPVLEKQTGQMPAFSVVKSRHAHFHRCAGEVLATAQQDKARALHMLEEGAYPDASEQVAEAIVSLFEKQAVAA